MWNKKKTQKLGEFLFLRGKNSWDELDPTSPQPTGRDANPAGLVRGPGASKGWNFGGKKGKNPVYLSYSKCKSLGYPEAQ